MKYLFYVYLILVVFITLYRWCCISRVFVVGNKWKLLSSKHYRINKKIMCSLCNHLSTFIRPETDVTVISYEIILCTCCIWISIPMRIPETQVYLPCFIKGSRCNERIFSYTHLCQWENVYNKVSDRQSCSLIVKSIRRLLILSCYICLLLMRIYF